MGHAVSGRRAAGALLRALGGVGGHNATGAAVLLPWALVGKWLWMASTADESRSGGDSSCGAGGGDDSDDDSGPLAADAFWASLLPRCTEGRDGGPPAAELRAWAAPEARRCGGGAVAAVLWGGGAHQVFFFATHALRAALAADGKRAAAAEHAEGSAAAATVVTSFRFLRALPLLADLGALPSGEVAVLLDLGRLSGSDSSSSSSSGAKDDNNENEAVADGT